MIKSQYSVEEVTAAMAAQSVLLSLMAEFDTYRPLHDNYTNEALGREVLRFMPELEGVWNEISDTVRNVLDRETFVREIFLRHISFEAGISLNGETRQVVARISRDFSRGSYPYGDGSEHPVYLTNGCCEVTEEYDDLLDELALDYGSFNGEFYPLTDEEAVYIADDMIDVAGGYGALMGYSAVYKGEKFLMPSIEVQFDADFDPDRDVTLEAAEAMMAEFSSKIEAVGGHVILDKDHDFDRHLIQILIPFSYAKSVADDYDGWKAHLSGTLLNSNLSAEGPAAKA